MTLFPRSSGILLHPTSLPGRYGIGDMGHYAYRFVDWLVEHGQSVWQVLPLGPTGYADSPYQTLSAFGGNPNLISLDKLVENGWLSHGDLADTPNFPGHKADYGWAIPFHDEKLTLAYEGFQRNGTDEQRADFAAWVEQNSDWAEDFALFNALKKHYKSRPWVEWPNKDEALYKPEAVKNARKTHARAIDEQKFRQWVFYRQWSALREYANEKGVKLIGDIPIFVAHDSSDVWANQELYYLDADGNPTVIAGVPPDYFSETGQRWGNPLYRWDKMKADGYNWWIRRFKAMLALVDYMRVDHFRGFEAYWEIPAEEPTAINGKWVPGPGHHFFETIKAELGDLPIIAEDLGVITEGVEKLRDDYNLPGMKVLQFAWGSGPKNPFLPHNQPENCIVYTGTHDNNTTIGWWKEEADNTVRHFINTYLERDVHEINWRLVQLAMMSAAHTVVFPMQDILNLGSEAIMNVPGREGGNWQWRFTEDAFAHDGRNRLAHYTWLYQRRPDQREKEYGDVAVRNSDDKKA